MLSIPEQARFKIFSQSASFEASRRCDEDIGFGPEVKQLGNKFRACRLRLFRMVVNVGRPSQYFEYRNTQRVGALEEERSLARSIVRSLDACMDLLLMKRSVDCLEVAQLLMVSSPGSCREGALRRRLIDAQNLRVDSAEGTSFAQGRATTVERKTTVVSVFCV
jgi:hypothetical protein